MVKYLWTQKSRQAKFWLAGAVTAQAAFVAFGTWNGGFQHSTLWTNQAIAQSAALVSLILAAFFMHTCDERYHGFGVRDVYKTTGATKGTSDTALSSVLSRESIQVAITLGILAALVEKNPPPSLVDMGKDPNALTLAAIMAALGGAVVTTLVGILCYDYSIRFKWDDKLHEILVSKGHDMGRFGFYALTWSLAAITSLSSYALCMTTVLIVFMVLWHYYFFPTPFVVKAILSGDLARNLDGYHLDEGDFTGKDLSQTSLRKASLRTAKFDNATLTGTQLHGADLSHASIAQAQLDSAAGDAATKLPAGRNRPSSWSVPK